MIDADVDSKESKFSFVRRLKKEKHACEWAMKIATLLIKSDNSWEDTESWTDNRGSKFHEYIISTVSTGKPEENITATTQEDDFNKAQTPLLLATIYDSMEIVREILRLYPQAVEHVDKDGHNILHLAIMHRRYRIIDVVEEMKYPLDRLRGRLDKNYNTLLHMVGCKVDELKEDVKHPAQQLKEDQRLFKVIFLLFKTYSVMNFFICYNQIINSSWLILTP